MNEEILRKMIADYQHHSRRLGAGSPRRLSKRSLERGTATGDRCQAGGTFLAGKPLGLVSKVNQGDCYERRREKKILG
jgi:hypothetical protein